MKTRHELYEEWLRRLDAFGADMQDVTNPVQILLARNRLINEFVSEFKEDSDADWNVSCRNILNLLRGYVNETHTEGDIPQLVDGLEVTLDEIEEEPDHWVPLNDFKQVARNIAARLKVDINEICFRLGAAAPETPSFGAMNSWVSWVKGGQFFTASLIKGPINAAMELGVSLIPGFNRTKEGWYLRRHKNSCYLIHKYLPWIDSIDDWFSIAYTNGHFAIIAKLYKRNMAKVTDLVFQWQLLEFLAHHGHEAEVLDDGSVVCKGQKIAEVCLLEARYHHRAPVMLEAREFFGATPFYLTPRDVNGSNQGWVALKVTADFPAERPIIWRDQIFDGPYHVSRFDYTEIALYSRIWRVLIAGMEGWSNREKETELIFRLQLTMATDSNIKHREEQLKRQRAELDREKAELQVKVRDELIDMKDRLMKEINHDLVNPAGVIMLYIQTVIDLYGNGLPEDALEFLKDAHGVAQDMCDQLAVLKLESESSTDKPLQVQRSGVPISLLIDKIQRGTAKLFSTSGCLRPWPRQILIDCPDPTASVAIEAIRIHAVLMNLLSNGGKYSDGNLLLSLSSDEKTFSIMVMDEGRARGGSEERRGMVEDFASGMFGMDYRRNQEDIDDGKPGTGLGQSLVDKNVRAHYGTIGIIGFRDGTRTSPPYCTFPNKVPILLPAPYLTAVVIEIPILEEP
ncbi:MAG: HAMP domain-containing sensor histidine kinase [bacterium]